MKLIERVNNGNGNGNGHHVVYPSKWSLAIGLGPLLVLLSVIGGITVPLYFKISAWQTQQYNYQVIDVAYSARRDCMALWKLAHANPVVNYVNECGHITVPALAIIPPN